MTDQDLTEGHVAQGELAMVVIQLEDPGAKDAPPAATIITEGR